MTATTSMLWLVDSDDPIADLRVGVHNDREQAARLAQAACPDSVVEPRGETTLDRAAAGAPDEISVGVFGRVVVIAGAPLAVALPSQLPDHLVHIRPAARAYLVHTDADTSYGVFAQWDEGVLKRSFAADPVDIAENEGLPFVFEREFWAGEHPLRYADGVAHDPQALPFHPVEFADFAATTWLGLRLTPPYVADGPDPTQIPLSTFAIRPPGHQPSAAAPDSRSEAPRFDAPQGGTQQTGTQQSGTQQDGSQQSAPDTTRSEPAVGRVARFFGFGKR